MYLQRYYLDCLSHASYMVADEGTRIAAVIDPQRDIDVYVQDAEAQGFKIRYGILTHFHADFVAGHIELRERFGAEICLGAAAEAEYAFRPLRDGDVIEFGTVRMRVLETPGHTPEGISLLLYDLDQDPQAPYAVFTGDTLFLGDVGRPDLLASIGVTAEELAEALYTSLHEKLLKLPDSVLVYPAHGAGSMCGRQLSDQAVSTLGEQRNVNRALQPMSREEFVQLVTVDQPEAPAYFAHDAMLNRQNRESLEASLRESLRPLQLPDVLRLRQSGAQVVDVRASEEFASGHLQGSINVGLDGKFATWAGSVLDKNRPIVVIAAAERVEEAVMRLGRIGFDQVVGYWADGIAQLEKRPALVVRTARLAVSDVENLPEDVQLVDVRTEKEWKAGHIPGSLNLPLNQLSRRSGELDPKRSLAVHCQGGYRSAIAVSLLEAAGFRDVRDMAGGYKAWLDAHPVVESA